jgi:uncharacterized membrane protein YfcA
LELEILILIGVVSGFSAGLFGLGGGIITVPALMYLVSLDIKSAVGISIVQMFFSSLFGTILNIKNNFFDLKEYYGVMIGAMIGASFSYIILSTLSSIFFEFLLLFFIAFATYRLFVSRKKAIIKHKTFNNKLLIFVSLFISIFTVPIGIGGSILLTPILIGRFGCGFKKASSIGLLFALSGSTSALIFMGYGGLINFEDGIIVGLSSIVGVYIGTIIKKKMSTTKFENLTLLLYFVILIMVFKKVVL